uniref:Potassium channel toxin alpha-KTx 17.2 n=1 Tax=Lychas mucronatus TaxID=172552 RepID=KA172_LYCMC|nr:RecName: Full=Potassium channel toxin alpha-KTx 17.2; Flags: Precursor [Lychas mucronatus]
MKTIIVLLLLTIVAAAVVESSPKARRQTECQIKNDCQRYCQSVKECKYGKCYCNYAG